MASPDPQDNVRSFEAAAKERQLIDDLRSLGTKHGIVEIVPISVEAIAVAEWVRVKCKYGCDKFGTSWCCSPETPGPEQVRAILAEYRRALLLRATSSNQDFYRDNQRKRRKQVSSWKGTVAIERRLFLSGYYKAFALAAERCALCKNCAHPEPCRFPKDKRPSVESFSIDVFKTIENAGREFTVEDRVDAEYSCYSLVLVE